MSQDTQNAGIGPGPYDAGPVPGSAPPVSGAAGMGRILKRETHSSRAVVSVIAATLVAVVCGYALLETGVRAIGQPPWIVDPLTAAERVVALPAGMPPLLLVVTGVVVAVAGLFFFLNAVLPGRRARHLLADRRAAVVVDDEVIAAALARRARLAANVTQEQVMVIVSRDRVDINVRPTSGVPLRPDTVLEAVRRELAEMGPAPMPDVRIHVATAGVVGA
ncbi:DUF6286 domain-containing protein [Arthrobacter sp. NicSoilB8]|uniref:DUF6286 domain-containing protein n=1 Tax=Arthrobacter sp. NicSoilB8 TaxID=2830998 RepID=UPI001CC418D5|nr:DUF6286 domain-containing protein [Arthrobacter sp. NicSoilB8]BCW69385.1 hypothetical protein NicSoilB8_04290 [Arthrobacter sp. NicSoilB8]